MEAPDNFMPTGQLTIQNGLAEDGEPSWRMTLDSMSQTEAIGIMVVVAARYIWQAVQRTRNIGEDEE